MNHCTLKMTKKAALIIAIILSLTHSARASLIDSATDLGGGWRQSPWLGKYYADASGWVHEEHLGWMYEMDGGADSSWLYVPAEGWYWTGADFYPNLYRYAPGGWVWYWPETIDPHLYYDYSSAQWTASDGTDGNIWKHYFDAIIDARTADYNEISHTLTAVNTHNDTLPWNESHDRIEVASWVTGTYVSSYVPGQDLMMNWESWVSVEGEVLRTARASGLTGDALTLRIKQLMGLRPDRNYAYWVTMEVRPADLFRPAPDPEPGDSEAMLDFPAGAEMSVSDAYKLWFANQINGRYVLARWGFPWTRLGYTYDWAGSGSEVGVSEFVIRPGSTVRVVNVQTNAQYLESQP
jgi:hypothetical protein